MILLDCRLDANAPRMRLSPNEARVDDLHLLVEAADVLQAVSEHLGRFQIKCRPWGSLPSVALLAMVQAINQLDAFSDIDLTLEALDANVALVGRHHDAAEAASNLLRHKQSLIGHLLIVRDALAHC